jgi:hypothetical protein
VIERFRRRDAGRLEIEVTIDDSKAYTKLITYTQKATIVPDENLLEYFLRRERTGRAAFQITDALGQLYLCKCYDNGP